MLISHKKNSFNSSKSLIHVENSLCSTESEDADNGAKALGHKEIV